MFFFYSYFKYVEPKLFMSTWENSIFRFSFMVIFKSEGQDQDPQNLILGLGVLSSGIFVFSFISFLINI
jgi:hypothetical protein